MSTDSNSGMGLAGFVLGWIALGLGLDALGARARHQEAEVVRAYAGAMGITEQQALRELTPAPPGKSRTIRRLTMREAWCALRQGRYLEACRERVREAKAAAQ